MMTIGERIKNSRIKRGFSQVELADKVGISKQTLYKYEHNIVTNIPSDKVEAISEALGTEPSVLMGWAENLEEFQRQSSANQMVADRLYDAYLKADPNTQKIVRMLLKIDGGEQ